MRPKFIADADLNELLIAGLRKRNPTIDFLPADEGGTRGLPDLEVLRIAASCGRVLVSHDSNTMIAQFKQFISANTSPGLLIVRQQMRIGVAIEAIEALWEGYDAQMLMNQVWFASTILS